MDAVLLDTDMLSEILKQRNPRVVQRGFEYLREHQQFTFSVLTRFEITRGYKEKHADRQLAKFSTFCQHSQILPLTDAIFERAADLWAAARRFGHPHGDADILIAATALDHNLTLVTGNTSHFTWIENLSVADWRDD